MIKAYFLGAFVAFSSLAQAQFVKSMALKPGLSLASQSWDYGIMEMPYEYRTGLYATTNLQFIDKKYWGISADLGYIRKGNRRVTTHYTVGGEHTLDWKEYYDYITFSPLLRAQYPLNKWTPYVFAGPRVDYLVSYGTHYNGNLSGGDPYLNKGNVGVTCGLGVEYKWNRWGVLVEGQKFFDFNPVYQREAGPNNTSLYVMNKVFVMNTGVRLYFNQ